MKRQARSMLSEDGQRALDGQVRQPFEDILPVAIRNYLSDFRQFIAWCEAIGTLRNQTIIVLLCRGTITW